MSAPAAAPASSSSSSSASSTAVDATSSIVAPSSSSSVSPTLHSFSFAWMESFVHAQIWFLQSSLFVWIGDNSATMHSLNLAIKSDMDSSPSVTCLLGHGHALGSGTNPGSTGGGNDNDAEDDGASGMAARLASVFGIPVFVSLNISPQFDTPLPGGGNGSDLQVFIERSIIKELKICQKLNMFK